MGYLTVFTVPFAAVNGTEGRTAVAEAVYELAGRDSHQDGPAHARTLDVGGVTVQRVVTVHSTQGALVHATPQGATVMAQGRSGRSIPGAIYVRAGEQLDVPTIDRIVAADQGRLVRCADGHDLAELAQRAAQGATVTDAVVGLTPVAWPDDVAEGLLVFGVFEDRVRHGAGSPTMVAAALGQLVAGPWEVRSGEVLAPLGVVSDGTVVVLAGENRLVRWSRLDEGGRAAAYEVLLAP